MRDDAPSHKATRMKSPAAVAVVPAAVQRYDASSVVEEWRARVTPVRPAVVGDRADTCTAEEVG